MFNLNYSELEFSVTRSQGPGGQHVNRTNSCVQLKFSITESNSLSQDQKDKLLKRLSHRLVQGHYLMFRVESERDQKSNKDMAVKMLIELIQKNLIEPKKRKPTKPKKSAVRERLASKKTRSDLKKLRTEKF